MGNEQVFDLGTLTAAGNGQSVQWAGGEGTFAATGTLGGGTAKLQCSFDNVAWLDVDRTGESFVTFTAPGMGNFVLPACWLRLALTGGTGASVRGLARGTRRT